MGPGRRKLLVREVWPKCGLAKAGYLSAEFLCTNGIE